MKTPKPKGKEERESLDAAFGRIRGEWKFATSFGLTQLIQAYQRFVQDVEAGYEFSIQEYTYDLAMRDLLESVQEQVPSRLQQEICDAIRPLDDRLHMATRLSVKPIDTPLQEPAKEWWFRIPRQAGPELQKHLLAEGLAGKT